MMLSSLIFGAREWVWPAAVLLVVAAGLLGWSYRRSALSPGIKLACLLLKSLGILALGVCLLEPLWSSQRARPGANFLAILGDNSQGMQLHDPQEPRSRGEEMKKQLTENGGWQRKLEENFAVRRFQFDSQLQGVNDFSALQFDGRSSSMASALKTVRDRFLNQPLAGVILFTDGNATDIGEGGLDLTGLPPIYPVVVGKDESVPDISLQQLKVAQSSFEDAPVSVQIDVATPGFGKESVEVQLAEVDPTGLVATNASNVVQKVVVNASEKNSSQARFQLRPKKTGVSFFKVEAGSSSKQAEATLLNNARLVAVDRGAGPYRVLYVSGRPNWEYKFLHRAVQEDDQLELAALIRVASKERKFEFRGKKGETSNPLYRGFDKTDEGTERYDQPVLVRLNTRDKDELRAGFPSSEEELFAFHAVIVDDLEAEFFTRDQMSLLQRFVGERGGGFLMLGGQETFARGKYDRTPIGEMLPVYLDRLPPAKPTGFWELNLTKEGWLQPWARLRGNEAEEAERLQQMPAFQVLSRVGALKPGASVIATVQDTAQQGMPALIVQRFGQGRSGAITVGDLWRWGLQDDRSQKDLAKAWRQMVRWIVADVPHRFSMEIRPLPGDSQGGVRLAVRAHDKKFLPLDNATVQIKITHVPLIHSGAGTNTSPVVAETLLAAEASADEAGIYQADFVPRQPGGYRAVATIVEASGQEAGKIASGWTADPAASEFQSLRPNRELMKMVAQKTGGQLLSFDDLDDFARRLPLKQAPISENWAWPVWHQSWVFLFALSCLIAEWGLRRWKGLA